MTLAPDGPQTTAEKHRAAAVELLELADHPENSYQEELHLLWPALVHVLLAIESRLANPVVPVEPGLCPSKVASPVEVGRAYYCQLKAGHAGLHEMGDVTWTEADAQRGADDIEGGGE